MGNGSFLTRIRIKLNRPNYLAKIIFPMQDKDGLVHFLGECLNFIVPIGSV